MELVRRIRLVAVASLLLARLAGAQESENKAAANALFDEGRALLGAGETAKACAKFEASVKVLSQLGTRLNLAACYEKLGRLASAWAEFREAASIAARANDDREHVAREQVAALEPRLSRLTVKLAPGASMLELRVTRDGVVVVPATLDSAVPVDPGQHTLAATAPGYKPWETKVTVGAQKDSVVVEVPKLEKLPDAPTVVVTPGASPPPPVADEGDPGRSRKILAFVVGGAGLATVAAGGFFGLRASSKWDDAKKNGCNDKGVCSTVTGKDALDTAKSSATISTVLTIAGGAAVAAGVVLYFTAPSARERSALRIVPLVGPDVVGIAAGGAL
jgi:hypothetical protein